MNTNDNVIKDYLDPKYAYLRITQYFCNILNKHNKQTESGDINTELKLDKPIIFTHSYVITGEIIPFSTIHEAEKEFPLKAAKSIHDSTQNFLKKSFDENILEKNPSKLLLIKNASIRSLSSNQITNLPVFCLFSDQIVGFTFGHLD